MPLRLWYRHCWQAPSLWPDAFKWPLPPHARIFFVSEISSENSFYCNNRPAKPYSQLFYNKATSHINNTQTQPVAAPGPNGCYLHFPQAPLSRALQRWAPQLGVCHWALWGAQRTGEARPGQAEGTQPRWLPSPGEHWGSVRRAHAISRLTGTTLCTS